MKFSELVNELENWTRLGKRSLVANFLKITPRKDLSIDEMVQLCKFANRNHFYNYTLRVLYPIKLESSSLKQTLSNEFITTYASALVGVGSIFEARELLIQIKSFPPALLSVALSYFNTWSYDSAVACLEKYIKLQNDEYMNLVGQINLAAAHIGVGNFEKSYIVLTDFQNRIKTHPRGTILYGNSFELLAQIQIYNQEHVLALDSLNRAKEILQENLTRYLLYVNKWEAVANLNLKRDQSLNIDRLRKIKNDAQLISNWETIRDCDFHIALFTNDQNLMQRNLQGTPFKGYHDRVKKLFGIQRNPSHETFLNPFNPEQQIFSLKYPEKYLIQHNLEFKLVYHLTRDLYKPPRYGELFAKIYPDEIFNPYTSPKKIQNLAFRANQYFERSRFKIFIKSKQNHFYIMTQSKTNIRIESSLSQSKSSQYLNAITIAFKGTSFTGSQVALKLNLSKRKVHSILNEALDKNIIRKLGSGRSTRYILKGI